MARWYDWTLVTEDEPDEDDIYYVTWEDDHKHRYVGLCEYDADDKRWMVEEMTQAHDGWTKSVEVVAWMACPEAYEDEV